MCIKAKYQSTVSDCLIIFMRLRISMLEGREGGREGGREDCRARLPTTKQNVDPAWRYECVYLRVIIFYIFYSSS
jgi:hypothetical protein